MLESGFTDFETIRKDSTLARIDSAELEKLIEKYAPERGGLFGFLNGPSKSAEPSKAMEMPGLPKITIKGFPNPFAAKDS